MLAGPKRKLLKASVERLFSNGSMMAGAGWDLDNKLDFNTVLLFI